MRVTQIESSFRGIFSVTLTDMDQTLCACMGRMTG